MSYPPAKVRCHCFLCGNIEVEAGDVKLFVAVGASIALMDCPTCDEAISRTIPDNLVHPMLRAGVRAIAWEPPVPSNAHPLTIDDPIDLHEALKDLDPPGDEAHTVNP